MYETRAEEKNLFVLSFGRVHYATSNSINDLSPHKGKRQTSIFIPPPLSDIVCGRVEGQARVDHV